MTYSYRVNDAEGNSILRPAIENLDLSVRAGEFIVLTGSSGCGKTTVCRLINGLIPHYFEGDLQGEVLLRDQNISVQPIYETARTVGSVFQNPRSQFFNVDTTSELAFAAENQGREASQIRQDILKSSELLELDSLLGRSMFALSGGEKQKIACGSVAVADTDIVVLDEPSSNLDMDGIEELKKTLMMWKEQGKTVIIAEHRLFFLRELADRVLLFENGRIKQELTAQEFSDLSEEASAAMGIRSVHLTKIRAHGNCNFMNGRTIQIENMEYSYPDKIHGIHIPNLILPQNAIIAITGHNGAGKSTFARTLCGLNKRAKGVVHLNGKPIPVSKILQNCYMIMQDVNHQLFTESVLEEVLLSVPLSLPDDIREEKAREALRLLDMESFADIHPMALSGGQKQRVAIASGIAAEKEIILMDEPTSGLDYLHMKQVAEVLRMLKESGKTVLMITHDFELIAGCADYVLHLENGKVKYNAPIENSYLIARSLTKRAHAKHLTCGMPEWVYISPLKK